MILREVCESAGDASRKRCGDGRVCELGGNQPLEVGDKLMHALGWEIETEHFDGHEAIAIRFVRTKDRSQRPCPDLMENTKWTERVRRNKSDSFRLQ